MELYNFFSETVSNPDDVKTLILIFRELKNMDGMVYVRLAQRKDYKNKLHYTIFGQLWGEDTNIGDTELMAIFNGEISYTWFDAFNHLDVHTVKAIR